MSFLWIQKAPLARDGKEVDEEEFMTYYINNI